MRFPSETNNYDMKNKFLTYNKRSIALITGLVLAFFSGLLSVQAQDIPDRPNPPRLVVDYTGTLSQSEVMALENKLVHFNDTSSNQIVVVLTNDFNGLTAEQYATGIGDKWGVGQAELDNGIVLVVRPKTSSSDGKTFISVGPGLGGAIPDITAGQIMDFELLPYFKQNDYYGGLDAATTVLMELAAGEYNSDQYAKRNQSLWSLAPFVVFIIIFFIIGRLGRRSKTIGGKPMSPWTAFWLGGMMGSGGSSSGWGGSSGGGFGGGGGGFGGFGGGSFGGGGAGGSW